ncbi:mitochondrial import inner membrane translocase subunit TIM14-like [Pollicipes pollicipes]|uniref:mitochondrial import inner membrane translocase subunit TIM14-like n=1 Tax=Pollicipes pollicipes TaxID=41117 RepID=UPI0018858A78|nr:mitochondrial import inner membrane translocase subunit TIM14-like [Pollicipes pollicipes]
MASTMIVYGLGLATIGFGARYVLRAMPGMTKQFNEAIKNLPQMDANSRYYRGGFESKMSRREASLVLGVSPSASAKRVKEAHKRIMLLNHPDRGGSPYLAAKINEAKDLLDSGKS